MQVSFHIEGISEAAFAGRAAGENFLAVDFLGDGERETRIRFDRTHARETVMETVDNVTRDLHLWQVTSVRYFIQFILTSHDELKDCEYISVSSQTHFPLYKLIS